MTADWPLNASLVAVLRAQVRNPIAWPAVRSDYRACAATEEQQKCSERNSFW